MTVVKTNLYRVLLTLIIIGSISVSSLVAQCNLNNGDTLAIRLPLGTCSLSNSDLIDSLLLDACMDAFSVFPAGPFQLNSSNNVEIFDQNNMSLANIVLEVVPYGLIKHPKTGSGTNLANTKITYELQPGFCTSTKDVLLDALLVPNDEDIRNSIEFLDGPDELFEFRVGSSVLISEVLCNGHTYWEDIEIEFIPDFPTKFGNLAFNKALTTCPTTIEDVLAGIGWFSSECTVGRLQISNSGPFGYGNHFIQFIKLDDYFLAQNINVWVNAICNFDNLDFGTIPANKCYIDEFDILEKLGLNSDICDNSNVAIFPPGPYEDVNDTIMFNVFIDGIEVCKNLTATFQRDTAFDELSTLFCNNYLNISLNTQCEVLLTAETLLEGGPYCFLNYILTARNQQGQLVDQGHQLSIQEPGTYSVSVSNPRTGNSCWGTVVIEDKYIYDIRCVPDTVWCFDNNDLQPDVVPGFGPDFPDVGEPATWELTDLPNFYLVHTNNACGVYYAFYVDVLSEECLDAETSNGGEKHQFKAIYDRYWEFEDRAGNIDTCIQKIYVYRPDVDDVEVDDFETNCLDDFVLLDEYQNPLPEETGVPIIKGTNYPADICGTLKMTYRDTRFPLCGRSVKIIREWILIDWCNNRIEDYNQVILVEDNLPPVFLTGMEDLYLENDPFLCGVEDLQLEAPYYEDCGSYEALLEIRYEDYDYYGNKQWKTNGPSLVIPSLTFHEIEGEFQVVYLLTDECGNTNTDTILVHIRDTEPPIAVCDEYTAVSVGGSGLAQVRALTFDDLSVDNCGIVNYEIRKVTGKCYVYEEFSDVIRFCCEEVGDTILVEFKVTDAAGNYNTCMVVVDIQDKFPPLIYCPADVVIDCQDDFDDLTLTGEAWAIDNCEYYALSYSDQYDLNECGEGIILREWTATDFGQFQRSCTQEIRIQETEPFGMTPERWPANVFLIGCGHDLSPDATGTPDISTASCSNVAYSHEDAYFNTVKGACFKIVREWTVIDWCRYGRYGPEEGIWRYSQIIKQENETPPDFYGSPLDTTICLFGEDCIEQITISADAYDDCTAPYDLLWYVELYDSDFMDQPIATSASNSISEFLVPGDYVAIFRASDGCGNVGIHEQYVRIVDCDEPVVECPPFAPSVVLGNSGQVSLWISDFNLKTRDNCSPSDKIALSFSPDSLVSSISFTCQDVVGGVSSKRFIQFYALDEAGNAGYCEMEVEIKDNSMNLCDDMDSLVVSGLILTEELGNVDNVEVAISNGFSDERLITDLSGTYAFGDLEEDVDYVISLRKNSEIDDGLTTFDLILIARHAVGLKLLESPYKIIAADLDNNERVTVTDLFWLRQIILGNKTEFPNGQQSWRFVDERYDFPDPRRPWPFPEAINISKLVESHSAKNFIAVKIGDVNGTNAASKRVSSTGRSAANRAIYFGDLTLPAGISTAIPVTIEDSGEVMGFQFSVRLKQKEQFSFNGISAGKLDISSANYRYDPERGILNVSWNTPGTAASFEEGDVLFYVNLTSTKNTRASTLLAETTEGLQSEWIDDELNVKGLDLNFKSSGAQNGDYTLEVTGNYPNPFRSSTALNFTIGRKSLLKLEVFDLSGRKLYDVERHFDAGQNEFTITSDQLQFTSGILLAKLSTEWGSVLHKMTLVK